MNEKQKEELKKMEADALSGRGSKGKGKMLCTRQLPSVWKMIYTHMNRYNFNQSDAVEDLLIDGFNFNAGET